MVKKMAKWTIDADTNHGVWYWLRYWVVLGAVLTLLAWWGSWLWGGAWSVVTALVVWAGAAVVLAAVTLLFSPFVITLSLILATVALLVLAVGSLIHIL